MKLRIISVICLMLTLMMTEYYKWVLLPDGQHTHKIMVIITILDFVIGASIYLISQKLSMDLISAYNWTKAMAGVTFLTTFEIFYVVFGLSLEWSAFWTIPAWILYLIAVNLI